MPPTIAMAPAAAIREAAHLLSGAAGDYDPLLDLIGDARVVLLGEASHSEARLAQQFDAVIHLDETHAVEPLDGTAGWDPGEPPETFPTGL